MERGTKLYSVRNGKLETYMFIQEQILDGAINPTYTVRDSDGNKALVATDYYQTSEIEAWIKYVIELKTAISGMEKQILQHRVLLDDSKSQYSDAMSRLMELGVKES